MYLLNEFIYSIISTTNEHPVAAVVVVVVKSVRAVFDCWVYAKGIDQNNKHQKEKWRAGKVMPTNHNQCQLQ